MQTLNHDRAIAMQTHPYQTLGAKVLKAGVTLYIDPAVLRAQLIALDPIEHSLGRRIALVDLEQLTAYQAMRLKD